ncbi:MAG: hypothetical protein ABGY75_21835 [Gemmataceae bacterium]
MRFTGWAVLLIGVVIGAYCLFAMSAPPRDVSEPAGTPQTGWAYPLPAILGPFALVAVVGGLVMILRGGGVIRTRNPAVRN